MKQLFQFIMICLYVVGLIGGIGYCLYYEAWLIAAGVAALALMAWPVVKKFYEQLTNGDD